MSGELGDASPLSPLQEACKAGDIEATERLIAAGATLQEEGVDFQCPLLLALQDGFCFPCAVKLVQAGADLDVKDEDGLTPLHLACAVGSLALVEVLLQHGASIEARTPDGETPLLLTAAGGHPRCFSALLEAGASVDEVDSAGQSSLLLAAVSGCELITTMALQRGADPDLTGSDADDESTALMLAAEHRHQGCAMALLAAGADVSRCDDVRRTALHYACAKKLVELVRALLKAGADPTARDRSGQTPRKWATQKWKTKRPKKGSGLSKDEKQILSQLRRSTRWWSRRLMVMIRAQSEARLVTAPVAPLQGSSTGMVWAVTVAPEPIFRAIMRFL